MATTEHELWLDEMPKKRVKNKDELRQDPAQPQVDAVVMNDTADGPGAMDSSYIGPSNTHPEIDLTKEEGKMILSTEVFMYI